MPDTPLRTADKAVTHIELAQDLAATAISNTRDQHALNAITALMVAAQLALRALRPGALTDEDVKLFRDMDALAAIAAADWQTKGAPLPTAH